MSVVPVAVSRAIARNVLVAQKNSPGILLAAGVVGSVASTVLACRATLKMQQILDNTQNDLKVARNLDHPEYSEKDRDGDVRLIYTRTTFRIAKAYAPAVIVGALSIGALTQSHGIMSRRNAALTAAYAALEKGFNEYRARVRAKYGDEEDRALRYGTREIELSDEDGNAATIVRVAPGDPSIYARFFDVSSTNWNKDPEYNLVFLKCIQNYANDRLIARGHVFLNEIYDDLGIPRSRAGAVVGWVLSRNGETDNHIDFGVFDRHSDRARDFVNGYEGAILLDFNVDGVIYDKIGDDSWQPQPES